MAGEEAVAGARARAGRGQMEIHSGNEEEQKQETPQGKAGGLTEGRRVGGRAAHVIDNLKYLNTEGKMLLCQMSI